MAMSGEDWQNMSREKYKSLFHLSPVERAGYLKLMSTMASLQKNPDS
jgi:hypothetical protein